jgi:hypothetical protein
MIAAVTDALGVTHVDMPGHTRGDLGCLANQNIE